MSNIDMQKLTAMNLPQALPLLEQLLSICDSLEAVPKAVVYGAYNSGKSSLLNSLTGHIEQEYFATHDIPETRTIKTLEQGGICYVDTPGLDVNEQDDREAGLGVAQSDILLFVHKLSSGPVQQQDRQAMQQLMASHGRPGKVLLVITGAEEPGQQALIENISQQMQQLDPGNAPFLVSNTRYRQGMQKGKQVLIERSGIPELQQALQSFAKHQGATLRQQRADRVQRLKKQMLDEIAEARLQLKQEIDQQAQAQKDFRKGFVARVQSLQMLA